MARAFFVPLLLLLPVEGQAPPERNELARTFEENRDQFPEEASFVLRGPGYEVRAEDGGIALAFSDAPPVRIAVGGTPVGEGPVSGYAQVYDGDRAWRRLRLFSDIVFRGDADRVTVRATEAGIELEGSGDPTWEVAGATAIEHVGDGEAHLRSGRGNLVVRSPGGWVRTDGARSLRIDPGWRGAGRGTFRVGVELDARAEGEIVPPRITVDGTGCRFVAARGADAVEVAALGDDDGVLDWSTRILVADGFRLLGVESRADGGVRVLGEREGKGVALAISAEGDFLGEAPGTAEATAATPGWTVGATRAQRLEGATILGPMGTTGEVFVARRARAPGTLAAGCPGSINFDNSAGTGLWTTPTNWDLDQLPGPTDDVCIGPGFSVTLNTGTQSVASLTTDATASLTVSGGTLTLASASSIGGGLTFTGGTINGAGDLSIGGLLTWNAGSFGGGAFTNANGGIAVGGVSVKDLASRILKSSATTTWTGTGQIRVSAGSTIQNLGTWDAQSDASISPLSGTGAFTNTGTFKKSAGAGTTTITIGFDATGPVEIQSGTVSINGSGTNSSAITGSPGTTLRFNGALATQTLDSTSNVSVPTVVFDGGTVNVNGTYAATTGTTVSGATANFGPSATLVSIGSQLTLSGGNANFASGEILTPTTMSFSSGNLQGSDTLTISGLLTWSGGSMQGGGTTNANGGIAISGSAVKDLSARTLKSTGTTTWTGTGAMRVSAGSTIENQGTWDAQSDASINPLSGTGTFSNAGTFKKSAGVGTTTIALHYEGGGPVEIQTGTLSLNGGGTISSSITGSAGTTLRFNSLATATTLDASSSVSAPTVVFDGGTVDVNGTYAATTGTTVSGGTASFGPTATLTSIGNQLTIATGTASFSSGETVSPATMTFSAGALQGSDTLTVSGLLTWTGGSMQGGGTTNANGGIAISGSAVKDLAARTLRNAVGATWTGTGQVRVSSGSTIDNQGTWDAQSDATIAVLSGAGTFTNAGTLRKSAGAGTTSIDIPVQGAGGIEIQSGTLRFLGGGTLSGSVTGSPGTTWSFAGIGPVTTLTSSSTVAVASMAVAAGTVDVQGSYSATLATSVDGGTLNFGATSTLTSIGSSLTVSGGTATLGSGETVTPATLTLTSGRIDGADTLTISGTTSWSGGTLAGGGITNANGGVAFSGSAVKDLELRTLNTAGSTTWTGSGPIRVFSGSAIHNAGTWDAQSDALLQQMTSGTLFDNTGTFRKSGGAANTSVSVPFTTSGSVEALSGAMNFTGGFVQTTGTTTQNGGVLSASAPLDVQGGTLRGTGTVAASVTSSGTTSPGLSPGILGVGGSFTQSSSGKLFVELGGTNAGTQHDRLDVTGAATIGGTLEATFVDGYVPVVGDLFTVLTCGSRSGTFPTTTLPALGPGQIWNVIYESQAVRLKIVPLPSGRVPGDLGAESRVLVAKNGASLDLSWGAGCLVSDVDYEIYEGTVGAFTSHVPVVCSTGGALAWTVAPGAGNRYYLVVPTNGAGEGSYGYDGALVERPASASACRVQSITNCP